MSVFRIHIRPDGGDGDPEISFEYCLQHDVLGMGWSLPQAEPDLNWEEYHEAAVAHYGHANLANVRYLYDNVHEDHLIWTRDTAGIYYLARVVGPWQYVANDQSIEADIVNLVPCQIHRLQVDEVPGKVVACFRPPRTIQAIRDNTISAYSRLLWNLYAGFSHYPPEEQPIQDIFALLDDKATEDAVAIYLQLNGWLLVPGSRQANNMGYEYILIHRDTGQRAVVQVKTGHTALNQDNWAMFAANLNEGTDANTRVFLFQSYGNYTGAQHQSVQCIDPDELRDFLFDQGVLLPRSIRYWVDFVRAQDAP